MKKRIVSLLMAGILSAGLLAGCGQKENTASSKDTGDNKEAEVQEDTEDASVQEEGQEINRDVETTIRFAWQSMAGSTKEQLLLGAIEQLEEMYPNVTVEIENAEPGKYASKISMDVSSDNTCDIFSFWRPEASYGTDKFIEAGALADLSELLEDEYFKGKFEDSAISTCSYKGTFYGMPENYAFIVMLANTEVLADCGLEVPTTWDEWIDSMSVIKEHGYIPWGISTKAFASGWERPLGYVLDRYLGKNGETGWRNEDVLEAFAGNVHFNTPEGIEACNKLYDLCAGNAAGDAMTLDDTQATSKYFNNGKAAYWVNGTYGIENIDKGIQEKCVTMVFPEIPGAPYNEPIVDKDVTGMYYVSSKAWADPVKKQIIYDLFKILYSDEFVDDYFYQALNLLPLQNYELDAERIGKIISDAKVIADKSEMVKWPLGRANPENKEAFYSVYTDFWAGKYTGEEFAVKLDEIFYNGN